MTYSPFIALPAKISDVWNITVEAMAERWRFFFGSSIDLPTVTTPIHRERLRNFNFDVIRRNMRDLWERCFDARQIGGWVDVRQKNSRDFRNFIAEFGYDPGDFYFDTPYEWSKAGRFFEICHRLLNEVIVYPNFFRIDSSQPNNYLQQIESGYVDGTETKWSDWTGVGTNSWVDGYPGVLINLPGGYGAYYFSNLSENYKPDVESFNKDYWIKAYTQKSWIENHTPLKIKGTWFIRYELTEYHYRSDNGHKRTSFGTRVLQMNNDRSEYLPALDSITPYIDEIKELPENAKKENLGYNVREDCTAYLFHGEVFLTQENMPELPYKYYSKGE